MAETAAAVAPHPERVDVTAASVPAPLQFREAIDALTSLGLRTAELARNDQRSEALAADAEARTLFEQVFEQFPDAGERSLDLLIELYGGTDAQPREPYDNSRLGVLQVVLATELARRQQTASATGEHARADALTQALLDATPICSTTAEMADRCLHEQPYLRACHEPTVLHLLHLAGEDLVDRDIVTHLLLTLWDNLKASGQRSSSELSQLALVLLGDSDPSKVVAACRQLLADDHYRSLALAWLRERDDRALATEVAQLAAQELPIEQALQVLRELGPMLSHTRGVYLGLAARAPERIADAYREQLAADTHPEMRRELVMGVGMLPDEVGLEIAELALQNDPSPDVRIQAMFAFTVHAEPAAAERAMSQVLDDPVVAGDAKHLGAVVLALQNLEQGDPNTVARLGARLRTLPLSPQSRELLDEILARSLPGGGTGPGAMQENGE
ncbi:MAG TPA: hypothetical protein ENI87_00670 [bacterium]|nr:hypothetical protein [bacterium]